MKIKVNVAKLTLEISRLKKLTSRPLKIRVPMLITTKGQFADELTEINKNVGEISSLTDDLFSLTQQVLVNTRDSYIKSDKKAANKIGNVELFESDLSKVIEDAVNAKLY